MSQFSFDLQQFAADLDFDFDAFDAEFNKAFPDEDDVETQDDGQETQEPDDVESQEPETQVDQEPEPQDSQMNKAFQQLRQQAEENKRYRQLIEDIGKRNGMTPEQVVEAYEQQRLEEEAKKQNASPEILQRLQQLEQENQTFKQQMALERYKAEVEATKARHNLTDDDVKEVIRQASEANVNIVGVPFEVLYKAFNYDKALEQAKKEAVQEQLEAKKKRQETTPLPNGDALPSDPNADIEEDVLAYLKSEGLI